MISDASNCPDSLTSTSIAIEKFEMFIVAEEGCVFDYDLTGATLKATISLSSYGNFLRGIIADIRVDFENFKFLLTRNG